MAERSRKLRVFAIVAGALVVLLVVAAVALRSIFTPERLRAEIQRSNLLSLRAHRHAQHQPGQCAERLGFDSHLRPLTKPWPC